MAILTPYPKFRAFDSNGDPLAGGKLQTWIAGTNTPKATFTDQAGGTPNTNPIILDPNGEADLWLATDSLYQFELRDSGDALQWTVDNIGVNVLSPQIAEGFGIAQATAQVTTIAGDDVLIAAALVPPNVVLIAAEMFTEVTFGGGQGLTAVSLGISDLPQQYGQAIPLGATTETGPSDYSNYARIPTRTATDIIVTAEGGKFDGTGSALITAFWETHTANQTL